MQLLKIKATAHGYVGMAHSRRLKIASEIDIIVLVQVIITTLRPN
jgi:hypothetical protein